MASACVCVCVCHAEKYILLLLNIEPVRVLQSYNESLRPRHMDISHYIQDHRQPGDVVISNVPAGHANIFGGADYYLMHRMSFFDAVYKHDGRVIDRWEGGVLLTNFDQLASILEKNERVWIHMFDRQLPKDLELARFFNVLQTLGEPVKDTYGAQLRLWKKEGRKSTVRVSSIVESSSATRRVVHSWFGLSTLAFISTSFGCVFGIRRHDQRNGTSKSPTTTLCFRGNVHFLGLRLDLCICNRRQRMLRLFQQFCLRHSSRCDFGSQQDQGEC